MLLLLLLLLLHPFVFDIVLVDTIINKIPTYFHETIYLSLLLLLTILFLVDIIQCYKILKLAFRLISSNWFREIDFSMQKS